MQIFPASRPTSTSISEWWWWWGRGEGSSLIFWSGLSNMIQEPLAFTTPCSAAILLPQLFCNMCAPKANEKAYTRYKIIPKANEKAYTRYTISRVRSCTVRPKLVSTVFKNAPIFASLPTCFISRSLNTRVWPQVSFDFIEEERQ